MGAAPRAWYRIALAVMSAGVSAFLIGTGMGSFKLFQRIVVSVTLCLTVAGAWGQALDSVKDRKQRRSKYGAKRPK